MNLLRALAGACVLSVNPKRSVVGEGVVLRQEELGDQ